MWILVIQAQKKSPQPFKADDTRWLSWMTDMSYRNPSGQNAGWIVCQPVQVTPLSN